MEHKCPWCGGDLPESAAFCPHCAQLVRPRKKAATPRPLRKKVLLGLLSLMLLLAVGAGLWLAVSPKTYDGHGEVFYGDYQVLLYCGIVISDVNDTVYSLDQMLTHVMFALAKARETHQNTIWFFDSELHKKEVMDNYVEGHMNQALQEKEFRLYLQPKVDLKTDALGGAEALVRWQRHDGTMIFPSQFIPLFEENGFCAKLDMYMVEQVCACLRQWMDAGLTPVPVSVNQSKLTFFMPDYVNRLMELADRYQIPSGLLTLEILEGMALENVDALNRRLEILREKD